MDSWNILIYDSTKQKSQSNTYESVYMCVRERERERERARERVYRDRQFEILVNFFVGYYEAGVYVDSTRRSAGGRRGQSRH